MAGNIDIWGSELRHISGFQNLVTIDGRLHISTDNLEDISGFQNLTYIGNGFYLYHNAELAEITGLSNLETIGGDFLISDNPKLLSLSNNFPNLTVISGSLNIDGNILLQEICDFENVSQITNIHILDNDELVTICGFNSMEYLYNFSIFRNIELNSINGFNSLHNIVHQLNFESNISLTDIDGFSGLETIKEIFIRNNQSLESLDFLSAANSITTLVSIKQNSLLSMCSVPVICEFISDGGEHYLLNNSPGCNTTQEILDNCNLSIIENQTEKISVYPNPTNNILNIATIDGSTISEIEVYNNLGQLAKSEYYTNQIDFSKLSVGLYFVKAIMEDGAMETIKVVKK